MSFATLTGCSRTTNNYMKELNKISQWKATSTETNGSINVEAKGISHNISFTSTGYASGNKLHSDIKFTDESGMFNIPEMEMYAEGSTAYINKSYYEGLFTLMGEPIPEGLKNVNAQYIAIDTGMKTDELKSMIVDTDALLKLSQSVFGDSDIDLPYVQNEREYTINLDSDQIVDFGVSGINAICNNLDNVNSTFKLGLTAEAVKEVKNQVTTEEFEKGIASVKDAINGSTVSKKEVFEDSKYSCDYDILIKVKDLCEVNITSNGTSTKAEVKDITMPTSVAKFTQEQMSQLFISEQQTAVGNSALAKVIEKAVD
jgi:hypothetical protein